MFVFLKNLIGNLLTGIVELYLLMVFKLTEIMPQSAPRDFRPPPTHFIYLYHYEVFELLHYSIIFFNVF